MIYHESEHQEGGLMLGQLDYVPLPAGVHIHFHRRFLWSTRRCEHVQKRTVRQLLVPPSPKRPLPNEQEGTQPDSRSSFENFLRLKQSGAKN